jgi:HD superfamily phosphohydrolase
MIFQDKIYGKVKIESPLILELINSPSLQRLKDIDQVGYLPLYQKFYPQKIKKITRFEHSLGVFILLKKFQAPFEEQIAGLLHDISHGVFSHALDYVFKEGSEKNHTFQDNIFEDFIKNSEIPSILSKYGIKLDSILNKNNLPLLERELPDLCADRIDYSLRNAICNQEATKKEIDYFLKNLLMENNLWVFKNFQSAQKYAKLFYRLNKLYYSGFPTAVMFRTVGDVLRYCLENRYLKREDLFSTEKTVLKKIKSKLNSDPKLKTLFQRMTGKIKVKNDPQNYDVIVYCKSRIVDPLFKDRNKIKRLSQVDKNWRKILKREVIPKKYFLKFKK